VRITNTFFIFFVNNEKYNIVLMYKMAFKKSRSKRRSKQRRSRNFNKRGGGAYNVLYIVYGSVHIDGSKRPELCAITVDKRSARLIAADIIPNMVNKEFIKDLTFNNIFVQKIIPDKPNGTEQIEILKPGSDEKNPLLTNVEDHTPLYYTLDKTGVVESIYFNEEQARQNHPDNKIETIKLNHMNWKSVLFI
jgi:hypothetical protein